MPATLPKLSRTADERVNWISSIPFLLVHVLCLSVIFTGLTSTALILFAVMYFGRAFFVTAAYHRYFSHKSYRLNRFWQLVFAFQAEATAQKGVLWWAANHRHHHRSSDTEPRPPLAAQGLLVEPRRLDPLRQVQGDRLRGDQGLRQVPGAALARQARGHAAVDLRHRRRSLIGGWSGLVVGFFWSTVLLWHTTFLVNSAAHVFGRRRYETADTSRNSLVIALLTGGEGWHNNHHHYQASARQGFFWWEIDPTYYGLVAMSWVGIVKDLKRPPARVLRPRARTREELIAA